MINHRIFMYMQTTLDAGQTVCNTYYIELYTQGRHKCNTHHILIRTHVRKCIHVTCNDQE